MHRTTSSIITFALAAAIVAPAVAAPVAADLVAMEAKWSEAMVAKDFSTVDSIVASDWTGQNPGGVLTTKTMFMDGLRSGKQTITAMANRDVHVRFVGTIAIVQGMDDETSSYDGKDTSGTYSWTDVFQQRGGKWVAIASQVTPIQK